MDFLIIILIALVITIVLTFLIYLFKGTSSGPYLSSKEAAGLRGEKRATELIKSVLREDDYLFTNVEIDNGDEEAELDNVIVNKYGVFIIEVKAYSGTLVGSEDDYEWDKYHVSGGGNTYVKPAKNPIRQANRQAGVLHRYLDYYGVKIWIEGYAIILGTKSPVSSDKVLRSVNEIDKAIHTRIDNGLSETTVNRICGILE